MDTEVELAQRNGEHLYAKLVEVNAQKEWVRQLPAQAEVVGWIGIAKSLPRVVSY